MSKTGLGKAMIDGEREANEPGLKLKIFNNLYKSMSGSKYFKFPLIFQRKYLILQRFLSMYLYTYLSNIYLLL